MTSERRAHPDLSFSAHVRAIVPSIAGWRTYPRALANLLLFGLVVLGGEWLVHELEYLIEYRAQFGAVMSGTPHRYYMAPAGLLLGILALGLLMSLALGLWAFRIKRRSLLQGVPARLSRHLPVFSWAVTPLAVGRTALALATGQGTLYLLQENLECVAVGRGWPGASVFFAPQHATVIPLHLLVALLAALLLWILAECVGHSHHSLQMAGVLARLAATHEDPPGARATWRHIPSLRPLAGSHGLRSPPLTV